MDLNKQQIQLKDTASWNTPSTASQAELAPPTRSSNKAPIDAPKPRGRPRKNPSPAQASAHAELPTMVPTTIKPGPRCQYQQQHSSSSKSDQAAPTPEVEHMSHHSQLQHQQPQEPFIAAVNGGLKPGSAMGAAGGLMLDAPMPTGGLSHASLPSSSTAAGDTPGTGQQLLPSKRKRNQLFNVKDVMRAADGVLGASGALPPKGSAQRPRMAATPPHRSNSAATGGSQLDLNESSVLDQGARELSVQRERRRLVEAVRFELGPDSLAPETNVATLVQRVLKCGVLAGCGVEYRKRARGMGPEDYNKGMITESGLIRCGCHNQDLTMSEFEQHSNSQIHRPAEYIFVRCIDMSLKAFAQLVLASTAEGSSTGQMMFCSGCLAPMHMRCGGLPGVPSGETEWLCPGCVKAGVVAKQVPAVMTTRASSAAAAAAAAAAVAAAGTGTPSRPWQQRNGSTGAGGSGSSGRSLRAVTNGAVEAAAAMLAAGAAGALHQDMPQVLLSSRGVLAGAAGSSGAAASPEAAVGAAQDVDMLQRTGSNGLPVGVAGAAEDVGGAGAAGGAAAAAAAAAAQNSGGSPRSGTATSNPPDGLDRKLSSNAGAPVQGLKRELGVPARLGPAAAVALDLVQPRGGHLAHHTAAAAAAASLTDGERLAAVQAALRAGSSLLAGVLGAEDLVDAQRQASQAGSQLLHLLQQLL